MLVRALICLIVLGLCSTSPVASGLFGQEASWRFDAKNIPDAFGAEEFRDSDNTVRIPEPMVFDLVRPLGASKGEFETNVLAIIPLGRRETSTEIPDPIGIVQEGKTEAEWAPEVELAIADGIALEFELPFESMTMRAYKLAGQWTFGTGLDDRFIHGTQGILYIDRETGNVSPVLLYLAGVKFDDYWSALAMIGFRTEIEDEDVSDRTSRILNLSVFRHLDDHWTAGVETNTETTLSGKGSIFVIPQLHWEVTDHWMLQFGAGARFTNEYTLPESAFRLIRTF